VEVYHSNKMIIKDINSVNQDLTMGHSIFIMCFELIDPVEVMVRRAGFGGRA
jgi:hypothetical protein